jgi:hypothetical protein
MNDTALPPSRQVGYYRGSPGIVKRKSTGTHQADRRAPAIGMIVGRRMLQSTADSDFMITKMALTHPTDKNENANHL